MKENSALSGNYNEKNKTKTERLILKCNVFAHNMRLLLSQDSCCLVVAKAKEGMKPSVNKHNAVLCRFCARGSRKGRENRGKITKGGKEDARLKGYALFLPLYHQRNVFTGIQMTPLLPQLPLL